MKNIHLIPTEKPSKLYLHSNNELQLRTYIIRTSEDYLGINQHIYITSDEEIKEGDWFIGNINGIIKAYKHNLVGGFLPELYPEDKKIILTDNPDLIADGVQAIDNEFLEWFVKNPSCESVEVDSKMIIEYEPLGHAGGVLSYKIIIPQEEPKQETLEEAAEKYWAKQPYGEDSFIEGAKWLSSSYFIYNSYKVRRQGFKEDAKWQAKRMYSEEEVLQIVTNAFNQGERYGWDTQKSIENIDEMRNKIPFMSLEKYLEQYKKK